VLSIIKEFKLDNHRVYTQGNARLSALIIDYHPFIINNQSTHSTGFS
jgi:hypothetical protein